MEYSYPKWLKHMTEYIQIIIIIIIIYIREQRQFFIDIKKNAYLLFFQFIYIYNKYIDI